MEKRYFINNKVYVSKIEMPRQANKYVYIGIDYINWEKSLTELACYKSELDKIKIAIWKQIYTDRRNPIDITSITNIKDGKCYFKLVESEINESIELKYTTQEMIDAVNYGFKYATESQNHTGDVPIGNILQWIMYKRNLLNVPKEFEILKKRKK